MNQRVYGVFQNGDCTENFSCELNDLWSIRVDPDKWHVNGELGFDTRWKMDLKAKRIISKTNILSLIVFIDYLLYLDLRSNPNGIYKC